LIEQSLMPHPTQYRSFPRRRWNHVYFSLHIQQLIIYGRLNPTKIGCICPLITSQCQIPQKRRNSTETGKFRTSAQNSAFRGKLWSLNMTVDDKRTRICKMSFLARWIHYKAWLTTTTYPALKNSPQDEKTESTHISPGHSNQETSSKE